MKQDEDEAYPTSLGHQIKVNTTEKNKPSVLFCEII